MKENSSNPKHLTQKNDSGKKNSYVKVKNLPTDNIHK